MINGRYRIKLFLILLVILISINFTWCNKNKSIQLICDNASNTDIINRYQKYCAKTTTTCIYRNVTSIGEDDTFQHPSESQFTDCLIFTKSIILNLKTDLLSNYNLVKFVDISYGKVENVEDFAFSKKSLVELNLRGNKIKSLSGLIFNEADHLKSIDLSHNEISSVNDFTFVNLKSLIELNLSNNLIAHLDAFQSSKSLKFLDLSFNKLSHLTLPFDSFSKMPMLEVLNLRNNSIGIDFGNFASNFMLKVLDLSYCGLTYFDITVLLSIQNIEKLYLHGNGLKYASQLEFESSSFPLLHTIGLSDNEFACEVLASVIKKFDKSKVQMAIEDGRFVTHSRNIRGIRCF